jgi:hypothetical protein
MIGRLSSAISTNDCRPALLLPPDCNDYMPWPSSYGAFRPGLWIDQHEQAYVGEIEYVSSSSCTINSGQRMDDRLAYGKWPVSGDSGSPVLLIADELAVPIVAAALYSTVGGWNTAYYNAEIRAAAAALGCDTNTIVNADFAAAGYTSYLDEPPIP